MPRARFIRPEFFTDEKVSDLPFGCALLFAGIWCQADLRGVFECSPRLLRGLVFPMRDGIETDTIGDWLNALERSGMILRFEHADKTWAVVVNWSRYQEITTREIEIGSHRPVPPDWSEPEGWAQVVAKARVSNRIGKSSPWNGSGTVLEPTQNPTPTATPTATDTRERDAPAPVDEFEQERKFIEGLGGITRKAGKCIIPDWIAATKGLKTGQVEAIMRGTTPGIQWPSEFKRARMTA